MALCPLAATVLTKEGLIKTRNLELLAHSRSEHGYPSDNDSVSRAAGVKRDPSDPLSAVAFGVYGKKAQGTQWRQRHY
jgi:hypothetical protein